MDSTISKKIETFNKSVIIAGEEAVFTSFPTKILALNDLISTFDNPSSQFHDSRSAAGCDTTVYCSGHDADSPVPHSKKRKLSATNGAEEAGDAVPRQPRYTERVVSNKNTTELNNIVKHEAEELAVLVGKAKLWVTLSMPKIEDGDNFGVQVQEEALGELSRAHEVAINLRDCSRSNHLARAKICSKLIKYPNIEDYAAALLEHDDKQLHSARQHITDIRDIYASLADVIHKNIAKIRSPKGNNRSGLY